jgi:hypothetical protein
MINMKKLVFVSGLISANLMMSGSVFKVMHWPFASVLLTLAVLSFSFIFLPSVLIHLYNEKVYDNKLFLVITFVVFAVGTISILFKIQSWAFARPLMFIALPLPFVLFLPAYLYQVRKEEKSQAGFLPVVLGLAFIAVFSVMLVMR